MNRIILIGNGLDLAHGLPTGYKDFINWYLYQWLKRLITYTGKNISDDLCSFSLIRIRLGVFIFMKEFLQSIPRQGLNL